MKIGVGKMYETRGGQLARILCTDAKGKYPVVGLISTTEGEVVESWTCDGQLYSDNSGTEDDLVREHVPVTYQWHFVSKDRRIGGGWSASSRLGDNDAGVIKLAFDPSGNLVIDKCEITGAQPNG